MLDKICKESEKLFLKFGIRSISMDEVARDLSMSKKTLYQFVQDKDDLVKKTISLHLENMDKVGDVIFNNNDNAIKQVLTIAQHMISMHREVSPSLMFDLKKYHPESYQIMVNHREKVMMDQLEKNIKLGIKQNIYRKNIPVSIVSSFYISLIETCISSDIQLLNETPFKEKYQAAVEYHLHAICSIEGLEYLNKNKKELLKID